MSSGKAKAKCKTCLGSGKVVHDYAKASSWDRDYQPYAYWQPVACPDCGGTGAAKK